MDSDPIAALAPALFTASNLLVFGALIMLGYLLKFISRFPNDGIPVVLLVAGPLLTALITQGPVAHDIALGIVIAGLAHLAHGAVIKHLEKLVSRRFDGDDGNGGNFKPPVPLSLLALLLSPALLFSGCGTTGTGTADSSGSTGTTVSTNPLPTSWTQFGLEAAGAGSATAIILLADPNNPSGTATDILTVCDASLTVVVGETVPSSAQIEAILASFKSDANTTKFGLVAQQWAAKLQSQLTALLNSGATADQAQQYIAWYILGAQTAAQGYLLIAPLVDSVTFEEPSVRLNLPGSRIVLN